MIKKLIFIFPYVLTPVFSIGQGNDSKNILLEQIDSIVLVNQKQYDIPGISIGIVTGDSIFYTNGYGVKNIETKELVDAYSIFHTASISKVFTQEAINKLVSEGQLSFDDLLIDIAPELNFANSSARKIRVRHLMDHSSGLPDVRNYEWEKNETSPQALKNYVIGLKLKSSFPPGSKSSYSNLAYEVLGYVIEKVSQQNFDEYLKKEVLLPAGMTSSDFRHFLIAEELRTSPHTKKGVSDIYVRKTYPYNRKHAPSSTLNASSAEMSKWMLNVLGRMDFEDQDKLLGFQNYDLKDFKAIGHFGGDQGYRSFLLMIPEQNIGLVLLANCDYNEDFRQEILLPIARLLIADSSR